MSEEFNNYEDDYQPIDLLAVLKKLLSHKKSLLVWICGGMLFGIIIAFSTPKEYESVSRMAPEYAPKTSASGSLGSLASMAGINLGNVSGVDAIQPTIYPEIVSSTPFLVDLFSLPVSFSVKGKTVSTDIYGFYLDYNKTPWMKQLIMAPFKLLSLMKSLIKGKKEPVHGYENLDIYHLTFEQGQILRKLSESITLSIDAKTNVISVTVLTQKAEVSNILNREVVDRLQKYVTNYRTGKARHDLEYYEELFDDAQNKYYEVQQKYALYQDANQGAIMQRAMIEQQRLQNEVNLAYQLYCSCSEQVQVAKAKVQQETPVFSIIQPANYPMLPKSPSTKTIVFICVFFAVCIKSFWILVGKKWCEDYKSKTVE